jgi:hypothetical protein
MFYAKTGDPARVGGEKAGGAKHASPHVGLLSSALKARIA